MELLNDAQMLKTMIYFCAYYPKLVKEFIINLTSRLNNAESIDYHKGHVRVHCFAFSRVIINVYLGHGRRKYLSSSLPEDHCI